MNRAPDSFEDVAINRRSRKVIVQVDAVSAFAVASVDVVNVVVANLVTTRGPVVPAVDRARVVSFFADVMDFVELDRCDRCRLNSWPDEARRESGCA